ncbi:MAG: (2E,6E)-farnesyl diphosphate synthase [Alteromonadaceae bacterium]|nr:(2E,6E)-farnesyl diphosphate synthase [Alteromonadaceae bacterium]MBL4910346.1 (2E,6E)-farnesyl diphosphate synthase [Alteromonadaceae bacterium]
MTYHCRSDFILLKLHNLAEHQQRINHFLAEQVSTLANKNIIHDEKLLAAMNYGLLIGGKRMRPYLVYITGETLGIAENTLDTIAGALECIHAYSLLHDDLPAMDDDDLRRGNPTCHIEYDEATAILAGDSLQTLAFDILANHPMDNVSANIRIKLIQQLANASGYQGMCGGQALDLSATNKDITLDQLEALHQQKTGALLKACVLMVAQCHEKITPLDIKNLTIFAQHVGLAYQVRDDIIDITSSEKELGKPAGSDLAANKSTYPALLGLQGAQQKAEQLYQQALQALGNLPYNTQKLADFATFIINRKN